MVVLPLLYPDVFTKFGTQAPRGVLFVGPPGKLLVVHAMMYISILFACYHTLIIYVGTGKTLTARALANSLSGSTLGLGPSDQKKVSFFMRKGADCLSKWVGEGERQLRLLFEQVR